MFVSRDVACDFALLRLTADLGLGLNEGATVPSAETVHDMPVAQISHIFCEFRPSLLEYEHVGAASGR